ncbi:phosphoenolpyruvate carboxykinase (ATP) [Fibrisoma limi BUZ 3]|uniref:Phosphoenolpyruvate carboxykinase (ATP) n=1 Tax=Fibrisoma limi BUZ 3 TaxID=1185876 RepID=I2GGM8_9BACT|nr:phosphoenolpyruvate carboxykinase (ATP) [Fibrisoma limi]CCH53053.1 phosphoenolpyruvate carboxykinase (ATP) [Fibrisoma limi BUZ 3]
MLNTTIIRSMDTVTIEPVRQLGLSSCRKVFLHLQPSRLVELALARNEGVLTSTGALMCDTGQFTGRSPKDKFIVRDDTTENQVDWGDINRPFDADAFGRLHTRMLRFLEGKETFVRYAYAGAAAAYRQPIAVVTTKAWQNLFCHNLFIRPTDEELADFEPVWTILSIPEFKADPEVDGTRQANFTIVDVSRKMILIGGTGYAGEIKKGIFTALNFILPVEHGVLSMHCSANVGQQGRDGKPDTALFFGLSGTGKTTLSADPGRQLIGDDEHGWSDEGVFNIEGGCYAKVINLSAGQEPQIYNAIRFGAILENTRFRPNGQEVDYSDGSVTENTRTAYPLNYIDNALIPSVAAPPTTIFFLTADAFGVLPPLSKLTPEQAMFYFLSGYTSKLAGTEMGVTEPVATFSACFGAAFLPLAPERYAQLLGDKLRSSNTTVWLVNTGWVGGPYGIGSRISLRYTRALLRAVLNVDLTDVPVENHDVFGVQIPVSCPDVPAELLRPELSWSDPVAYREQALRLQDAFQVNFSKYADSQVVTINQVSHAF